MGALSPRVGGGRLSSGGWLGRSRPLAPRARLGSRALPRRAGPRLLERLAALALALALAGAIGALLPVPAPDPPHPHAPAIHAPALPSVPAIDVPAVPTPDIDLPDVSAPDVNLPEVSLPSGSGGEPQTAKTEPRPHVPQTYRRYVNLHVHLWSVLFLWTLPWWPLAALAAAAALARVRHPLPRASRRWVTALDVAALAAVAAFAWAAAVTVPSSDGQPVTYQPVRSETHPLDDGDKEIVTTREERHRHLPIEIAMEWGLLALAASVLTGRSLASLRATPRGRADAFTASA